MLRKLMSLLALGFLLYAMCLALMWARQETLLFPGVPQSTADYGTGVQHLWLTAPDGIRLHAWYRPAISPKGTLLYFGGNAEEVHTHLANPERFAGWNLILVDYRGYAQSQGRAAQAVLEKDALLWAQAAAGELPEVPLPKPAHVAVMGRSLGSYYASYVAAHRKIDRLILVTPYDTMIAVAQGHYPWVPVKWLLRHPHNTLSLVDQIQAPTLFIAAEQDQTVPLMHAQRLYQAWRSPTKRWLQVPDVNHNQVIETSAYGEAIAEFLRY